MSNPLECLNFIQQIIYYIDCIYLIRIVGCNVWNNVFYNELQEKEFVLFAPSIRTCFKYQRNDLKKNLMNHMTTLFGPVFNQKWVLAMAGKYLKSVRDNYHTNISWYPGYEHPILVIEWEWDALI